MHRKETLEAKKTKSLARARHIAEEAKAAGRDFTPGERAEIDQLVADAKAAKAELAEMDGDAQLLAELNGLGRPHAAKAGPWSKAIETFMGKVGAKTLTTTGTVTVPSLSTSIVQTTDRPRSVLNLIPFIPLTTEEFAYIRETLRQHNATTVAVGKRKPESNYALERVDDRAHTIAHLTTTDRNLVKDVDLLGSYLDGALRDGVMLELEDQVLSGNGSVAGDLDDLVGVLNTSGIQAQPWDTDRVITARKAVTKLENLNLAPGGFAWVMSPDEWETYELLTSADHFVLAGAGATSGGVLPVDRARKQLWGYPVTTTTALADGQSLLGDWTGSIEIREREGVTVEWTQQGFVADLFGPGVPGDLFEANKVRFRGEGRWGLAVKRPAGFVAVDLTPV